MLTGKQLYPGTDPFVLAGRTFRSRLMTGTGKFSSAGVMRRSVESSGCHIVTVALRRVDFGRPQDDMLAALEGLDLLVLPNTSGAKTADEAVRLARLARASGMEPWIKLEVTPDPRNLLPDVVETLKAAEILVRDGFTVLPYVQADPILAKRLEETGCAAVMPLGSPIGSNLGILVRESIEMIIADATVPVVVDAGLGAPSHAALAMEIGADAVLVNTAIATADDPVAMAAAFRLAVEAGRGAMLAGFSRRRGEPDASSPLTGFLSS